MNELPFEASLWTAEANIIRGVIQYALLAKPVASILAGHTMQSPVFGSILADFCFHQTAGDRPLALIAQWYREVLQ